MDDIGGREIDVQVKHGRMRCMVQGEGDPLVLLHGALGTGEAHFRGQIGEFARRYRVIAPDFLGYGKSGRRDFFDADFHRRDAEDVAALVERLGLPGIHLCGFSDGAIVAMMVAGTYGELVRSLVLIGGQAVFDEESMETVRQWAYPDRLPAGFQDALARSHGDPYWREMVTDYVNAAERLYARGGEVASHLLPGISCPTLVIQGEDDPWVRPIHAETLRDSIPGSVLELFPGAGHEVQRDRPEEFNARVLRFLSSVEETSA